MIGLSFLPFYVRNSDKNQYYQKCFSDLNLYMEHFLFSFLKTGKILATLEDLMVVFEDDEIGHLASRARNYIFETTNKTKVEEKALFLIESEYHVPLISLLHKFCIRAEELKGDYRSALMVLFEYRSDWAQEVYECLGRHRRIRVYMGISVAVFLGFYYRHPGSENVTIAVLLSCFFFMYLADWQFCIENAFLKKENTKINEVESMFFEWAMMLMLHLGEESVQIAIQRSYDDAPEKLKPRIKQLIDNLRRDPDGIEPYILFLREYQLPEVHLFMKMLYSVS